MKINSMMFQKKRIPLTCLKSIVDMHQKAWSFDLGSPFLNWIAVLVKVCDKKNRKHNVCVLTFDMSELDCKTLKLRVDELIGFALVYNANKPKQYHPILCMIYWFCYIILLFSKHGRGCLRWRKMFASHQEAALTLGKQALFGLTKGKTSEGLVIVTDPKFQKQGVYTGMMNAIFKNMKGYFIFHTSTDCTYQAHNRFECKKIFEVPMFFPEKEITFIMYKKLEV